MVELDVIESPDQESIGIHQFFFPKIKIGKNQTCQFVIRDSKISSQSPFLEAGPNKIFLQSALSDYYHCNGKKMSGKKAIRPKDQFTIGQTTIVLIQYNPETIHFPLPLDQSKNPFTQSIEMGEKLLESIGKELIFIEYHYKE